MANLVNSKTQLLVEFFVAVILVAISTVGPDIIRQYMTTNGALVISGITIAVFAAYEILSPEGKAVFDELMAKVKKDDKGTFDISAFVGQFAAVLAWLGVLAVAVLAFVKSFFGKKEKYPPYAGVNYSADAIGDYARIDLAKFFANGKKQRVVALIPDGCPLMPAMVNGTWLNGAWFAPGPFVLYGEQVPGGTIVTIKDLAPEREPTLEELYLRIKSKTNPVKEFFMLYGEPAKVEMMKPLTPDGVASGEYEKAWQRLLACDTAEDVDTALDAFKAVTGYSG